MKPRLFGTLFYANYLTRALALYHSLERHCQTDFELVMLCMDESALRICHQLHMPRARLLALNELERCDEDLATVKCERTIGEYCWTCTPPFLLYLIDQVSPGEAAVYLDADLMFFSDPAPIFDEWGDADIAIHEHRFAPRHRHLETTSGTFNVGWVGIRNSAEGRQCLARWRAQCIEVCAMDAERGLCGDQKYLDEWPRLYPGLAILRHPGVGLGPWNVERYQLTSMNRSLQVNNVPVIFYHFHSVLIVDENVLGHIAIVLSDYYRFSASHRRLLYTPYAAALRAAAKEVTRLPMSGELARDRASLAVLAHLMLRAQILFARSSGGTYPFGSVIATLDLLKATRRRLIRWFPAVSPLT